ncbi:hypothetical protein K227x_37190 [Rubripirellula lacrimiformis]|uniref:Lipoprotein n=1 Tax=Rubripirellula lacrimiformis TaxID=1930273 RepID=A0A517NDW8_9BACT|nr:hypothetical protein [Rubripirellula lacrimiformis]QDT05319.1 hypothetical protein K227x_37190 [Rubripirellula lacrimiformis]
MNRCHIAIICTGLLLAAGCGHARYLLKEPEGGVVAIPSNQPRHREKAIELMQQHFPDGYEINREEEAVVGLVTHRHEHAKSDANDGVHHKVHLRSTATTTDKTEYRISYHRK